MIFSNKALKESPKIKRSPKWKKLKDKFLKKHPVCAVCGRRSSINVHHIIPYYVSPELELDENNLITLCEREKVLNCHLVFGHLGNWKTWNTEVKKDAEVWRQKFNKERKK